MNWLKLPSRCHAFLSPRWVNLRALLAQALVVGCGWFAVHGLTNVPSAQAQTPGGTLSRLSAAAASAGTPALPGPGPLVAGEVTVTAFVEQAAGVPGGSIRVGLLLEHAEGWHTYWRNPGDSGLPTEIAWRLVKEDGSPLAGQAAPLALTASEIQWPTPSRMPVGPLASYGYEDTIFLVQTITLPKDLPAGETMQLLASASWLVCKDVCIPGGAELSLALPVAAAGASLLPSSQAERFVQADRSQPVVARVSPRYALDAEAQRLILEGTDPPEAVRAGYFFVEAEGLVVPAAAQALYRTEKGWRLEIPLLATANRAVRELLASPSELRGVFRPAQYPEAPAVVWSLAPLASVAALSERGDLVSPGQTAAEAYATAGHGSAGGGGSSGFLLAVVLALVGGLLLNLMPCVFPVLGLKVLAFSQQAHSPSEAWRHGLVFTLGVVVSMLTLAGIFLGLRAAGEAVGWGFQLQNPWVVSLLALLFVVIALNLFGVFEMGLGLARVGGSLEQTLNASGAGAPEPTGTGGHTAKSSGGSAFGSGVLAVVVASPCTAPFMGSALGYTATASVPAALVVFASLGLGLALPYLVLAVWPQALARLPRPGAWMETFRQVLGFPMLATAAWLGWVLAEQNGPGAILALMLSWVCTALLFWVYGRWQRRRMQSAEAAQWGKVLVMIVTVLASVALLWQATQTSGGPAVSGTPTTVGGVTTGSSAGGASANAPQPAALAREGLAWEPGLPERLAAEGQVVFVDFTAAWCISCQANKARVIQRGAVADRLSQPGYRLVVADWTRQDPRITQELNRHGRNGVPLYLVYGPGLADPVILSEWLTETEVLAAFDRAALR
ncbi:MAG: protein-disulfide reductase DsbD family protein [Burkholderiaceae bacterium]